METVILTVNETQMLVEGVAALEEKIKSGRVYATKKLSENQQVALEKLTFAGLWEKLTKLRPDIFEGWLADKEKAIYWEIKPVIGEFPKEGIYMVEKK